MKKSNYNSKTHIGMHDEVKKGPLCHPFTKVPEYIVALLPNRKQDSISISVIEKHRPRHGFTGQTAAAKMILIKV